MSAATKFTTKHTTKHRKHTFTIALLLATGAAVVACDSNDDNDAASVDAPVLDYADMIGGDEPAMTAEEIERGRLDESWRAVVGADSAATVRAATDSAARSGGAALSPGDSAAAGAGSETWDDISAETVKLGAIRTPLRGDIAGPSVLAVQVLLDRAHFSPGMIDGKWGRNTEEAVFWLQKREGLPANGYVDQATLHRLAELAGMAGANAAGANGGAQAIVTSHTLTADDVKGPFVKLPSDVYARADMECLCYESLTEKLTETFHATAEVLAQLNPGVDLDGVSAGSRLNVPNTLGATSSSAAPAADIAKIVISDEGHYLHAVDAAGRVVYHFPTTLGSEYAPSPTGHFRVTNVAWNPTWHYQPDLLTGVDDSKEPAVLPAGPNNAVGVVWMQLSKPHYGIHGTKAPETIGYATSHGCVRLTNWDARQLAESIKPGVPVEFRDVS
jgi:lipoprotein-anchoring transpeptidase ErfK/SrfK